MNKVNKQLLVSFLMSALVWYECAHPGRFAKIRSRCLALKVLASILPFLLFDFHQQQFTVRIITFAVRFSQFVLHSKTIHSLLISIPLGYDFCFVHWCALFMAANFFGVVFIVVVFVFVVCMCGMLH